MKQNISATGRILRITLGLVLIITGYVYTIWWVYIIAAIALITGLIGYCGLYSLMDKLLKKI